MKLVITDNLTAIQKATYLFFNNLTQPADYCQIMEHLDKIGLKVNKTTVYRNLNTLLVENKITELDFGEGKKRYELRQNHHHHLVCNQCKKIECFEIIQDLHQQEAEIAKNTEFKITSHVLEFFGTCKVCQA
ncbi:transcriptional repressor [Candidatus Saccharibacteria bacterium HGW-Saccharibacteria-1]|jgi:Fe2+ or Zn2+ uptake regulation protein|nr:MAG: transcriptional repressor [Candidatus Saccharibacteria bacterium HGW-Saccharibacteria-1]